jgi:serine O-acetyltransferase
MALLEDLKYKTKRYYGDDSPSNVLRIIRTDGTSAVVLHRLSRFLLRYHVGILAAVVRGLNRLMNSCWIGRNVDFEGGFVIMHPYGIVINSGVKGGRNIIVQSGVVIGVARDGDPSALPVLGNNIYVGAGAKLLGRIHIGDNVTIGANAVVIKDVPDNATVVGVPGKIIIIDGTRQL